MIRSQLISYYWGGGGGIGNVREIGAGGAHGHQTATVGFL